MSFDDLKLTDYSPKKKEVAFDVGGKKLKFIANEISYMQRIQLAAAQARGEDVFTQLVIYSIRDEAGRTMTTEQAAALNPEYIEAFFIAASEVNSEDKKK